jgi:hypothetical protein
MIIYLLHILKLIRKIVSPILFHIFKIGFSKSETRWNEVKQLDIESFNYFLSKYKYNPDPALGIFDYTLFDLDYFLNRDNEHNQLFGRDCDDFAYAWYQWAKHNKISAFMILMIDGFKTETLHMTTVIVIDGKYHLCNYHLWFTGKKSIQDALLPFTLNEHITKYGALNNMKYVIYDKYAA